MNNKSKAAKSILSCLFLGSLMFVEVEGGNGVAPPQKTNLLKASNPKKTRQPQTIFDYKQRTVRDILIFIHEKSEETVKLINTCVKSKPIVLSTLKSGILNGFEGGVNTRKLLKELLIQAQPEFFNMFEEELMSGEINEEENEIDFFFKKFSRVKPVIIADGVRCTNEVEIELTKICAEMAFESVKKMVDAARDLI